MTKKTLTARIGVEGRGQTCVSRRTTQCSSSGPVERYMGEFSGGIRTLQADLQDKAKMKTAKKTCSMTDHCNVSILGEVE